MAARNARPDSTTLYASAVRRDAEHIDALYGLEPVYEPGQDPRQRSLDQFIQVECPHCWQLHESCIDLCLPEQTLIEDCQHCCHPMELRIRVDDHSTVNVQVERLA